jgi:hypothetical protein
MHPLAFPNNKSGFDLEAGPVKAGDKVIHTQDGRHGTMDEALQDGEAFVTWDDGSYDTVKWNQLRKKEGSA